jgi:hypothetical protein
MEDGMPDPQVDWPKNWEVCGYPHNNPVAFREEDKRSGQICLAMPMYGVANLIQEIEHICLFLEQMPDVERKEMVGTPGSPTHLFLF